MLSISNSWLYSAGLLLRLSNEKKEDVLKYGESGSIANQRDLLTRFCEANKINIYDTYIDDGESGAFYDRPAFTRMMEDIEANKVNLVLVKDLSRFRSSFIRNRSIYRGIFPNKRS